MEKFKLFLGVSLLSAGGLLSLIIRFTNVQLTETQLFLKFWDLWLLVFIFLLFGGSMLMIKDEEDELDN